MMGDFYRGKGSQAIEKAAKCAPATRNDCNTPFDSPNLQKNDISTGGYAMNRVLARAIGAILLLGMTSTGAVAETSPPACGDIPKLEKYGKESQDGGTYFLLATLLEEEGKDDFRLHFQVPEGLCQRDTLALDNNESAAIFYAPPTKGIEQILHYKIKTSSDGEQREIVVIYNGMLAVVANQGYYVAEFRNGEIFMYALYDNAPKYEDIKSMAARILSGEFPPAVGLSWPKGSKEAILNGYDVDRLTD